MRELSGEPAVCCAGWVGDRDGAERRHCLRLHPRRRASAPADRNGSNPRAKRSYRRARRRADARLSSLLVWWLIVGFIVMGALPVVAALLTGFVLQTAVYGSTRSQDTRQSTNVQRAGSDEPRLKRFAARNRVPRVTGAGRFTGRLTTLYGGCTFAMCPHWGTDIVGVPGTRVLAAADGVVAEIGWDPDGYGHYIILAHGGGWQTLYAHLQSPHVSGYRMKLNQAVLRGDPIGGLGARGLRRAHTCTWRPGAMEFASILCGSFGVRTKEPTAF